MAKKTGGATIQRLGRAIITTLGESLGDMPVWFRIPTGIALNFPKTSSPRKRPDSVASRLKRSLLPDDIQRLVWIRETMFERLAEDRLPNGGWGKRNNKVLRTFFGDLPDDFDTEGSITLTRWVIDAVTFSHLPDEQKTRLLDEKLNAYLDARFDRGRGASGRVGITDLVGHHPIHVSPRHTASSILCYLGLDSERFIHCAATQLDYLIDDSTRDWIKDSREVGHPDILRALFLTCFYITEDGSPKQARVQELVKECSAFLWDWLNSPSLIPKTFGPSAQLYLRLYSLCSVSDLSAIPEASDALSPLKNFRKAVHHDVQDFCSKQHQPDHRAWGFRALLLWSYLSSPPKDVSVDELKELLLSIIDIGQEFRDGFCVYWAVLFAIADSLVGEGGDDG